MGGCPNTRVGRGDLAPSPLGFSPIAMSGGGEGGEGIRSPPPLGEEVPGPLPIPPFPVQAMGGGV